MFNFKFPFKFPYNPKDTYKKEEKDKEKPKEEELLHCKKCGEPYPYAKPNQEDGTLICYFCRH